jgi:hypothetical protein
VTGWYSSQNSQELSQKLSDLSVDAANLTGGFKVLGEVLDLLSAIANDGYSPLNFHRILIARRHIPELKTAGVEKGINALLNEIVVMLQSNAAMYFAARYEKAIKEIKRFVEEYGNILLSLTDDELVRIQRRISPARVQGVKRTGVIRQLLRELEGIVSASDMNNLQTIVDNIDALVGKESAESQMARISANS